MPNGVSIRNLQPGFETSPLRHFKGVLENYGVREVAGNFPGTRVDLMFRDVEVIESTEPYHFPIAQISIRYSDKENSAWGIFAKSAVQFMPDGTDFEDLKGQLLEMKLTPGHKFGIDKVTGEEVVRDMWECVGIPSMAGAEAKVPPKIQALRLLDESTEQDWNKVVFADPAVKSDGELVQSILSRAFLPALVAAGVASQDENQVWHVDWEKVQS